MIRYISRVFPFLLALVMLSGCGYNVMQQNEEAVNRAFESTLAEGLLYERRLFHSAFATDDQTEGMAALVSSRSNPATSPNSVSTGSSSPLIGAAEAGSGLAASGICPSPVSRPEVASSPTQPAPGRYTSAQACRSVKSCLGPAGSSSGFTSATS